MERYWESLLYADEGLTATQRLQLHLPLASELTGWGVQSARWRREAAFLGSWHLCLGAVAAVLRFTSADQFLAAAVRSVRAPVDEAASLVRQLVPGYSFEVAVLFEEPDAKRQAELMEAVHAAKESELLAALWAEDPSGGEVAASYSSGGEHAGDFLLPPLPGNSGDKVLMMPEDEGVTAMRARMRIPYPSYLSRFRRVRGPAQQCNHQYSKGSAVCGQCLVRSDGSADADMVHAQLCNVGGGVDRRHNALRDWLREWLVTVCHVPWADTEQHVAEWDRWVRARCPISGALRTRTVQTANGAVEEPVRELEQARLDVAFRDGEGSLGYVDVAYANACSLGDPATTLARARTAGKAAGEREEEKRRRYPPALNPHVELIPFVVEARGRLGAEVMPFLRQHAPADPVIRSAVLARATREISTLTQRGLAALLLAAEPRPAAA